MVPCLPEITQVLRCEIMKEILGVRVCISFILYHFCNAENKCMECYVNS